MTINNKSERNYRGKCLGWPVTSYGGGASEERNLLAQQENVLALEEQTGWWGWGWGGGGRGLLPTLTDFATEEKDTMKSGVSLRLIGLHHSSLATFYRWEWAIHMTSTLTSFK